MVDIEELRGSKKKKDSSSSSSSSGSSSKSKSSGSDTSSSFTLYFHALYLNFAQNRVGIAETIQNQFGKSKKESVQMADKICERAGEKEFMNTMVSDMTENLADL